jgi:probable rRNA maturation factor
MEKKGSRAITKQPTNTGETTVLRNSDQQHSFDPNEVRNYSWIDKITDLMPSCIRTVQVLGAVSTFCALQLSSGLVITSRQSTHKARVMIMSPISRVITKTRLSARNFKFILGSTVTPNITRLLGSKAGVPGNPPGDIVVENDQEALPNLDEERLRTTIYKIRDIIGYPTYDVTLYLVDDEIMQETNQDTRGVNKPTDILSFPFNQAISPGILEEPKFEGIPDYYSLGEMLIDVPYVIRACQEDKDGISEAEQQDLDDDDEYEWVDDDRGVSGAMATVYDPEQRINMLLVHGMLHLVGHDHEEDDEYELMVTKEEEILKKLGMMMDPTTSATSL